MKKQILQDERIIAQRRKVTNEAYGLLMFTLLASILIQQYLFNARFEQYAAEFICFFGVSLFIIIRNLTLGLDIFGEGKYAKSMPIINSLTAGIVVTVINGVLNYTKYGYLYRIDGINYFIASLAVTFISATAASLIAFSCLNYFSKRKQAKIQKELDDEEQEE